MSCVINHLNKWAFLHIPKTGGTSLSKILLDTDCSEDVVTHGDLGNFGNVSDYFIFTIVRNPFTRIASAYQHNVRSGNTTNFKDFLENIKPIDFWYFPQTYFLNHNQTPTRFVNHIGRYEDYEIDVRYILNKLKIKNTIIPHDNRNPMYDRHPQLNQEKYYKVLYNDVWCKNWVLERYENDFKFFNYGMDI